MAQATIISAETKISGRIEGSEDVAVEGHVEGSILLSEVLHIAASGFVQGEARAREVRIDGVFVGDLQADERVLLSATARVKGNIITPLLDMADGAQLAGELAIGDLDAEGSTTPRGTTPVTRATSQVKAVPVSRTTPTRSTPSQVKPSQVTPPRATSAPSATTRPAGSTSAATTTLTVEEVEEEATATEAEQEIIVDFATETAPSASPEEALQELDDDYTVKELREELRRRDLAVSGTKAELLERLLQSDAATQDR